MPDTLELAQEYGELEGRSRELAEQARKLAEQMDGIATVLSERMIQSGVQKLGLNEWCLYLHRQVSARPKDGLVLAAVQALLDAGRGDLITLGGQKVSAAFRDPEQFAGLPPEVRDAFEVREQTSLRIRKAD